jgi:hypothetical protein
VPRHRRGGSITGRLGPSFFHFFTPQSTTTCAPRAAQQRSEIFSVNFSIAHLLGIHLDYVATTLDCCFNSLYRLSLALQLCKTSNWRMAPNGHTPAGAKSVDRSPGGSRPAWHQRHGSAEFKNWQRENPTQNLSYDEWKASKHVEGLSLYYAALNIWEESESSVSQSSFVLLFYVRA